MMMSDPTEGMSEAELAAFYDEHGVAGFDGGEAIALHPGPKDSVVSVRFAAGELEAVERRAAAAGMKLTAYIRAAALSGAEVVDLDRLRRAMAKLQRDSAEVGRVIALPTGRAGRSVRRSATTGRFVTASKAAKIAAKTTTGKTAATTKRSAAKSTKAAAARVSKSDAESDKPRKTPAKRQG